VFEEKENNEDATEIFASETSVIAHLTNELNQIKLLLSAILAEFCDDDPNVIIKAINRAPRIMEVVSKQSSVKVFGRMKKREEDQEGCDERMENN
jgi:hypothetical protein